MSSSMSRLCQRGTRDSKSIVFELTMIVNQRRYWVRRIRLVRHAKTRWWCTLFYYCDLRPSVFHSFLTSPQSQQRHLSFQLSYQVLFGCADSTFHTPAPADLLRRALRFTNMCSATEAPSDKIEYVYDPTLCMHVLTFHR